MDSLLGAVDSQLVLFIAAIAVTVLLFRLVFRFLNVGLGSILTIVAIFLILQYVFGISPRELWFEISHLPQMFARLLSSFG
ncbi:MAG: hypothetical protein IGS48_05795 [Oscillatoriales cyanobacterium C42_A2020_001]|nr:hypothetical protein [Leptolyngbyaceae cyanobacterium C42_A2020_001]